LAVNEGQGNNALEPRRTYYENTNLPRSQRSAAYLHEQSGIFFIDKAAKHVNSFWVNSSVGLRKGQKALVVSFPAEALTPFHNSDSVNALAKTPKKWSDQSSDGILSFRTFWKVHQMEFKTK
jgi:hypothetical protein